jgi:hypothetical protein
MSAALVLIWLGSVATRRAHQADLDAWAGSRVVELRTPPPNVPAGAEYDPRLVADIENRIDQARIAAGSLDERGALRLLDGVERELRAHPELPQAAWLMAERLRLEADLYSREPDGAERAAELNRRANALEGPRAESYTVQAEARKHKTRSAPARPKPVTLRVTGVRHNDRVYADGVLASASLSLVPGEHHLRVVRGGRGVWAGWVRVHRGQSSLALSAPAPVACSRDDIGSVTIRAGHVLAPPDTACDAWAVAEPADGGGVLVATCHQASCGPLLPWEKSFGRAFAGPAQIVPKPPGTSWTVYVLAGVGALAVTGLVLWRTGTFESPAPGQTTWRYYAPLRF